MTPLASPRRRQNPRCHKCGSEHCTLRSITVDGATFMVFECHTCGESVYVNQGEQLHEAVQRKYGK